MLRKKDWLIIFSIIYVILIIVILIFFSNSTYKREVAIITINNSKIENVQFGFQTLTLMQGFFNFAPKGDLRIYYAIEDKDLKQIFAVGEYNNIGNGTITLTKLKFPTDGLWEARFELSDKNLSKIDEICARIKFETRNDGLQTVSQTDC